MSCCLPAALLAMLAVVPAALAQPAGAPLPSGLSGRWTFVAPNGRTFIDAWSVRFEGATQPGPVAGRLTWRGVSCGAQDEPVRGTWDGTTLRFEAVLRPNVNTVNANGSCTPAPTVLTLKRTPAGSGFEGEAANDRATVPITAAP